MFLRGASELTTDGPRSNRMDFNADRKEVKNFFYHIRQPSFIVFEMFYWRYKIIVIQIRSALEDSWIQKSLNRPTEKLSASVIIKCLVVN